MGVIKDIDLWNAITYYNQNANEVNSKIKRYKLKEGTIYNKTDMNNILKYFKQLNNNYSIYFIILEYHSTIEKLLTLEELKELIHDFDRIENDLNLIK